MKSRAGKVGAFARKVRRVINAHTCALDGNDAQLSLGVCKESPRSRVSREGGDPTRPKGDDGGSLVLRIKVG